MKLVLSNVSGIPIYNQIKQQIISAILSEDVVDGEMLPSLRQLAKELKVSVLTTTRAYTELEQEGFIVTVQGKGCFVITKGSEKVRAQLARKTEAALTDTVRLAQRAGLTKAELITMLNKLMEE